MTQFGEDRVDNDHQFDDDGFCTRPCLTCGDSCGEDAENADLPCYGLVGICDEDDNDCCGDSCCCNHDCNGDCE